MQQVLQSGEQLLLQPLLPPAALTSSITETYNTHCIPLLPIGVKMRLAGAGGGEANNAKNVAASCNI